MQARVYELLLLIFNRLINMAASKVIKHPVFEYISIFVIISNSIVLACEDPTTDHPPPIFNLLDNIYLGLYTVELILKVISDLNL